MADGPVRSLRRVTALLSLATGALLVGAPICAQSPDWRVLDAAVPAEATGDGRDSASVPTRIEADRPFRLRIGNLPAGLPAPLFLQVRRNDGAWETLEIHDFPYPTREVEPDFADLAPGSPAQGWILRHGSDAALVRSSDGENVALAARGGAQGFEALYPVPWGAARDACVTLRFRLEPGTDQFTVLFGGEAPQGSVFVRFAADSGVTVGRQTAAGETILAEFHVGIAQGRWHEAEISLESAQLEIELDGAQIGAMAFKAEPVLPGIAVPPQALVMLADVAFEGVARTPIVSIVGESGDGSRTAVPAPASAPFAAHEWALVIRRTGDGPSFAEEGDRFAFRLADSEGKALTGLSEAQVTLTVPPGHLGGTFVETPGRIGPWRAANDDLYFIMEPSETDNKFMMMKSVDAGRSWIEVDGANRPETGDLEAVDARFHDGVIHILHQITRSVRYHAFRTSDHPTSPDSWAVRDQIAASADAIAQMATLVRRSDGSLVAVFLSDRLHYVIADENGNWSEPVPLGPDGVARDTGPQAVLGEADRVHLAYASEDGRIWYRTLERDGTLTERLMLAEGAGSGRPVYGAVLPLVRDETSGAVTIAYRLADGSLWERTRASDGSFALPVQITTLSVVTDAVDSQQAGADLMMTDHGPMVLFIDQQSRSIFCARKRNGHWSAPNLVIAGIEGSWIRGRALGANVREPVVGFVYDAGSKGGTGLNRYATTSCLIE